MSTVAPPTGPSLPADAHVDRAVAELERAELRLRAIVAAAANGGDRSRLAREALLILAALRQSAPALAGAAVLLAYTQAATAVGLLLGLRGQPAPTGGQRLATRLGALIDRGIVHTDQAAREAIRTVTPETLETRALDAVTARVDARGQRWPLAHYSRTVTATATRRSLAAGTADALNIAGRDQVVVSRHGTRSKVCGRLEGKTLTLGVDRLPPFHVSCRHVVTPAGFTLAEHVAAMRDAED